MAAPRRGGKTFGGQFFPERDEDDDLEPHQRQSTIAEAQFAAMEARDQQAAAAAQQQHPQTPSFMRALNRPSPSNFLTPSGHMRTLSIGDRGSIASPPNTTAPPTARRLFQDGPNVPSITEQPRQMTH